MSDELWTEISELIAICNKCKSKRSNYYDEAMKYLKFKYSNTDKRKFMTQEKFITRKNKNKL